MPTCKYSFGMPFPIRCACLARTARTLANLVVAVLSTSSPIRASPPSGVCAGGKAVTFGLKAFSVSFESSRKEKAAFSIWFMTVFAVGESIRSDVSSSSRRRGGETGSTATSPSFASAFAEGVADSARTVRSSDLGGRRKSNHLVLR